MEGFKRASLVILVFTSLGVSAQGQDFTPHGAADGSTPTAPPLVISLDTTMMLIDNPTPESYVVEMFFFFWDEIEDRHTIKATDVRLKANGTTTIHLKRFGSIFSADRVDPLPRTVAFTLRDGHEIYAICFFRKTDDSDRYVLKERQSAFLTESIQDIPGYRP